MPHSLSSKPFADQHRRWLPLFLAVLAVGLIAAACGDDDHDAPPDRLSFSYMAGFRAQANLPFVAVYVAEQEGFFDDVEENLAHEEGLFVCLCKHIFAQLF